ncbi:hypothetical protein SPLC1_S260980 [Arthrospira platensis C1]|nr:hypothetical protein SPLC1_S260980 [Arthrospira platensis C1]
MGRQLTPSYLPKLCRPKPGAFYSQTLGQFGYNLAINF